MHTVICSAGHIDHGKSSLIFNLTGVHPDRLKEEQEREMTTDLGFAFYGNEVTFIDVPGHEKFLKTMLAGVSSVDGCILVIAADDGVMPQTREHFEILQLLDVPRGIIALTKVDMVEPDWAEMVEGEIRELTAGTFLSDALIIPVSNRIGTGIDKLHSALQDLISKVTPRKDRGLFRMWIDRAFSIKGAGTVVAGTVLSGNVKVGDRVEILPQKLEARVKRIQVHNNDVPVARLGERAALNLPGIDKDAVRRGDLLALPEHYRPTYILNARLLLLSSAIRPLEQRQRIRLHLGSSEQIGRVVLLEEYPIAPGSSGFVQFRLESQALADVGDRFVVRSFSEGRVLGGGTILEIHPRKMKIADAAEIERLQRRESGEPRELVLQTIAAAGQRGIDAMFLARELALPEGEIIDILGALARDNEIVVLAGAPKWQVVSKNLFEHLKTAVTAEIDAFHSSLPHIKGLRKVDIKAKLMPNTIQILTDRLIEELVRDEAIECSGDILWRKGFTVSFSARQKEILEKIAELFKKQPFCPPDISEVAAQFELKPRDAEVLLTGLCETSVLLKLHDPEGKPMFYHKDAVAEAKRLLFDFFQTHNEMRFFEFRELLKSSRKFTTPILTYFDDQGLTYRDGEVRKKVESRKP
ncbi:MAG: selenocysteine-specific translation elongation factor [Calditrichaeota bacterium]|nr:selenocysteine-specific translation elongation factor [Calditrichota bacterium]